MANEQYYTYDGSGNRVVQHKGDWLDVIMNIDPDEHPILAALPARKVQDINPKILTDSLAAVDTSNAHGEGDSAPQATDTTRTTFENYGQLFMTTAEVSDVKNAIAQYGIDNEFLYQKGKKMTELLRDVEAILVSDQAQQAPTAANNRVGKMKGMTAIMSTHTSATFSEANLDTQIINIVEDGGDPNVMWAKAAHLNEIAGYIALGTGGSANVTVNAANANKRDDRVTHYRGPIGNLIELRHHYLLPQDVVTAGAEVIVMDTSLWYMGEVLALYFKTLPDTGPGPAGVWRYQCCIMCKAEQSSGYFTA